mgnify:CR=1 FL=1
MRLIVQQHVVPASLDCRTRGVARSVTQIGAVQAARRALGQRSIQLLATANTGDGDSAYAAQRRIVDALAVAIKSGTGQVSVGTLVSQINATNTAAGRQLADAVHDALEAALKTPGGHQSAKAVLKAMDQMRTRMENTRNYNLGTTASQLDTEHGTTAFARLTNSDHSDDGEAINSVTRKLGSITSAITQPASTSGRLLASNCFQCHGTGGYGGFDRIQIGRAHV